MDTSTRTIPVGDGLLGRAIDVDGTPLDGRGPLVGTERLPIEHSLGEPAERPDQLLESGIKLIDLFAPLVRGGTSTLTAVPGVGLIVASAELIQRIAVQRGGCAVIVDLEDGVYPLSDLVADLRSGGVEQHVAILAGRQDTTPEALRQLAYAGLTIAEHFCAQGRETLLFLNERLLTPQTLQRLQARWRGSADSALSVLIWQIRTPATMHQRALDQPLPVDSAIVFHRGLGKQNIWPAIDPLQSSARLLEGPGLGAEHVRVAPAARALLRSYGDLEGSGVAGEDERLKARARRVLLFGSQPFVVAEIFTARPGLYVPVAETVRSYAALLAGHYDSVEEEALRFIGALP